jgi:hypothetical protein
MAERGDLAGAEGEFRAGRGRHEEALAEFSAGRLQSQLAGSLLRAGWTVGTQTRAGRLGEARASLEGLDDGQASSGEVGKARAVICLAEGAPAQGLGDLQGVVDGTAPVTPSSVTPRSSRLICWPGSPIVSSATSTPRTRPPNAPWPSRSLTGWSCLRDDGLTRAARGDAAA